MNKRIKHIIAVVMSVALVGCFTGCNWLRNTTVAQKIALASTIAYEATFVGTAIDLKSHPERRAAYELSAAFLDSWLIANANTQADLAVALQKLPIKEFQSDTGALIVSGIVTVYSLAKDTFIDIANTPPWIAGVGGAISRGLHGALALSPSEAKTISTKRKGFVVPKR